MTPTEPPPFGWKALNRRGMKMGHSEVKCTNANLEVEMGLFKLIFGIIGGVIGLVVGIIGGLFGLVVGLLGTFLGLAITAGVLLLLAAPIILLLIIIF